MNKIFCFLAIIFLTSTVHAQAPLKIVTLPSGKPLKILSITKLVFFDRSPALQLDYETDLNISDLPALEKEVAEILLSFKIDVEREGLSNAVIRAKEPSQDSGILRTSKGYAFVFYKSKDGKWIKKQD